MYTLSDIEVLTAPDSRVVHVAPHLTEPDSTPHTLCSLAAQAASRLARATPSQARTRPMCTGCKAVLIQRAQAVVAPQQR